MVLIQNRLVNEAFFHNLFLDFYNNEHMDIIFKKQLIIIDEFDKIITTPNIPIEIRKRFLGHLFDMNRSDDFITWLCGQVRILGNAELISFCRSRVQNFDEL
jgi:hypothetical protein